MKLKVLSTKVVSNSSVKFYPVKFINFNLKNESIIFYKQINFYYNKKSKKFRTFFFLYFNQLYIFFS